MQKCIKIIRTYEDSKVKTALMKTFTLSDRQADAVLGLQLRRLGKLALTEVKQTIADLKARVKELNLDAKNPAARAYADTDARVKAYLKTPDEKIMDHILV